MTVGATMVGKVDPLALFDALAADLSARGMLAPDRIAAARSLVPGRLPVTALVDLGAPADAVLRALATLCGAPPAPQRKEWKLESRAQLRVDELTWQRLLAVPIGFIDKKPLIAYADVIGITSSMALSALPDHVPCVALESDVRDALSRPVVAAKSGVSFLAPPSAVASAMPGASSTAQAFGAGTAPALGGTMVGAGAPVTPLPPPQAQPSFAPFAPLGAPLGAPTGAPLSPSAVPSFAPLPSQLQAQLQGTPSFGPPPMAGATSPPGGMPLSSLPPPGVSTPVPGGVPSGSVIATMMATPLAPLPRIGTPNAQSGANLAAPGPPAATPSGTLLMGTASVPLDSMPRAPVHSISPGAPSFMGDAMSPSSPATGQSPFVPTEQPAVHREDHAHHAHERDRGGDTASMRPGHAQRNEIVSVSVGPGLQCGRFVLEKKLGEGGMATVFVARPLDGQGPTAAIKVVHEHLLRTGTGEELRRRFQREVNAMRQLQHKNIVACLDAGTVGDTEYLATELVTGGSLNRVLQRIGGRLSPMLALSFFGDMLEGLAHAHEKGVVHRDMKPDNILVGDDGTLKIADFGIARVAEGTQLTATGGIIGTPSYMSPEQALAAPVDARTDLYSAGVIFYEIITGRNPFEGDSVAATLGNVLQGKVRPVGEIEPALPFIADLVVMRLLSLRPDDRFPTARAALAALKPALDRAQEYRAMWSAVVQKQPGTLANAFAKEAEAHAQRARKYQRDLNDRTRAAHAAFRATSLMPDQREAKAVMTALSNAPGAAPIRLARSSTPALSNKEAAAERAQGDERLAEYRAIARMYLDEQNPVFAANYARRTAVEYGVRDEELALLAKVLPEEEVDDVRSLDARLGIAPPSSAETMMRKAAWRPPASSAASAVPTVAAPAKAEPEPAAGGAGMPAYLKVAIVIAASAIPIVGAIVALRGCG